MKSELDLAVALARMLHRGQTYGGTADYFEAHVFEVAEEVSSHRMATYGHLTVAYLHDVLEDTVATEEDLRRLFSSPVVDAVVALTRRDGEVYSDYIERVKRDPLAPLVKAADLRTNLHNNPPGGLRQRYEAALRQLGESP